MSVTKFNYNNLSPVGKLFVKIFKAIRLIKWEEKEDEVVTNNFTLINFAIYLFGPMHEQRLTYVLCSFQVFCTLVAFTIRYPLAIYFYGRD